MSTLPPSKLAGLRKAAQSRLWRAGKSAAQRLIYRNVDRNSVRYLFIAGVQRSGTNMVLDIFEKGFPYAVFRESDERVFEQYELRDLDTVDKHIVECRAPVIVIKTLCDTHRLNELLRHFSNSQALWVFRNMDDVVNSHLRKWNSMPQALQRIRTERNWRNWRAGGISDHSFEIVQEFVDDKIDNATACAIFWYIRNVQFFERSFNRDKRVFLFPYDQVVLNPVSLTTSLISSMRLPLSSPMTRHVHSNSQGKHHPPEISPQVRLLCEGLENQFIEQTKTQSSQFFD